MEQKILAISGRKQAGKNTAANYIIGNEMLSLGVVRGAVSVNEEGQLTVGDIFGDTEFCGIFDPMRKGKEFTDFANQHIFPFCKVYSFADPLKEMCIKILGLTYEQCYGTDEDKKMLTHLMWENMPGVTTELPSKLDVSHIGIVSDCYIPIEGRLGTYYQEHGINGIVYHPPGPMTAREVLQFVGTGLFRRMYENVWVDTLLAQIKQEGSAFAIICDARFPNEIIGTKMAGGKVIRLTRCPFPEDTHPSETALDEENFDWKNFDAIIDNRELSVNLQCREVQGVLDTWGWGPEVQR